MSNNNYILTEEDEGYLATAELQKWAHYDGDNEGLLSRRAMARKLLLLENPALEPYTLQQWLNSPVETLNGPVRLMNVLQNCGFTSIRQVYEAGSNYFLKQPNFGLRTKDELDAIFLEHGLIMRPEPTAAPVEEPMAEEDITVTLPYKLLSDMVNACHHNLAHYERQYGRFASRGKQKVEHDRLLALVEAVNALIQPFEGGKNGG